MGLRLVPASFVLIAALAVSGCAGAMMGGGGPHAGMGMGAGMEGGRDGRMMMAMSMGPMVGCPRQDAEAQLSQLHASLNINAAQEPAWGVYANAYRNRAGGMNMEAMQQHQMGPAPARLGHRVEMMEQHLTSMRTLRDALDGLYAALSPEQKATADALRCEPHAHQGH